VSDDTARDGIERVIEAHQPPTPAEWFVRVASRRRIDIGGPVSDLVNADRNERTRAPRSV
jgi:hypothetical protein